MRIFHRNTFPEPLNCLPIKYSDIYIVISRFSSKFALPERSGNPINIYIFQCFIGDPSPLKANNIHHQKSLGHVQENPS